MVARGLAELDPTIGSVVFIENVGNLVCPALFDLGERAKVIVCSVPEGDDKPIKYPHMFRAGQVVLLNKTDLLPHVPFDTDRFLKAVRQVNSALRVIPVSALHGDGLAEWYDWVRELAGCRHTATT
jgi:hydrogenase nickel incorporation protein HypB